ncbi:39S ribosomal protein L24, mitochondrial [Rhizophlyctis rosea]|nr:39S ribosomal protein L24, mitochondrial [Rhizophlyctis rosea]
MGTVKTSLTRGRLSAGVIVKKLEHAVKTGGPLAQPRIYARKRLPYELKPHDKYFPTLLHGDTIEFGWNIPKHEKQRSRRYWLPDMMFRNLWSHALGMHVITRLSRTALYAIDTYGGFDEYIIRVEDELLGNDFVTRMYRRKVVEALAGEKWVREEVAKKEKNFKLTESFRQPVKTSEGSRMEMRREIRELVRETYGEDYTK